MTLLTPEGRAMTKVRGQLDRGRETAAVTEMLLPVPERKCLVLVLLLTMQLRVGVCLMCRNSCMKQQPQYMAIE
jgi:hypothetical protein